MQKRSCFKGHVLFFILGLSIQNAMASGPSLPETAINKDPNCIVNANDPFEPHVRMTKGPDAGACINSTLRRSAIQLSNQRAAEYIAPQAGTVTVANFSHNKKFWIAQIPVNKIEKMILQSEHFPMMNLLLNVSIDHVQIRFDFSEPVRLVSQVKEEIKETIELKSIVLSVENISPRGEAFDFFGGAQGHYNTAYRLVSSKDKYKWMIIDNKDIVDQRKFSLNSKDAAKVLLEGIARGTQYGNTRPYDSFKRNCATEILDMLSVTIGTKKHSIVGFYSNALADLLDSEGVLTDDTLPTLNNELNL